MQIQNAAVTGSFTYNGVDISSITGSTSNITSLNAITASILSTTASLNAASGSAITRLNALEATSGSNITRIAALETASGSAITRLGSIEVVTGSNITRLNSIETVTGSNITRLNSLEAQTGSYATTGSNTFIGSQTITGSILGSGSLTINGCIVSTGAIVAQTINVQQVTSSIVYSCGSNVFGTALNNTQTICGNIFSTGSLACFAGNVCIGGGLVAQNASTFCNTVALFGATPQLYIGATSGVSDYTILKWCTTDKSLNIHNQSTNGSPQLVIACNGNVGVKTIAAPSYDLEVRGNIGVLSSTSAGLITTSTLCAAGTITGLVRFDGLHTPSLTTYTGPSISACKDDANYTTSLVFKTTDGSGINNTNLRITGAGVACFSSTVCAPQLILGGADQGYVLDVKRTSTGDSTFDTVANFYKASTHNTGLLLRLKNTIVDLAANNITGGGGPTAGMSFSVSSGGVISTALTITPTGIACFSNIICTPRINVQSCMSIGNIATTYARLDINQDGSSTVNAVGVGCPPGLKIYADAGVAPFMVMSQSTRGTMTMGLQAAAAIPANFVLGLDVCGDIMFKNQMSSYCDLSTGTSLLFICRNGNVGIGTTSTTNRLTVLGCQTGTQITTIPIGKFINTGNEFSKFIIGSDNSNYDAVISMDNNATLANTKLRFYIGNGTNSTAGHSNDQIVLQGNGNVGISTCAPNAKLTVWTPSTTGLQTALRLNNPFGFDNLNTGAQIIFSQDRSVNEDLKQGIIAVGQADAGTSATSFMAFYTNNTGLGERLRITSVGRVGILTNDPKGLFEVGMTCAKTTFGGFLFNTLSVADSNWFCFFEPPGNWAGLMTMHWVAPNDHNRSGAAQVRWSYQNCSAGLGPTTSIFNDSQNATATFRYAGGWLQACITGAGAGYNVQFTILGARGA